MSAWRRKVATSGIPPNEVFLDVRSEIARIEVPILSGGHRVTHRSGRESWVVNVRVGTSTATWVVADEQEALSMVRSLVSVFPRVWEASVKLVAGEQVVAMVGARKRWRGYHRRTVYDVAL